jgi:hypothetical protein
MFGRQWCVAVFNRDSEGRIRMALLSNSGQPDLFRLSRGSSDPPFIHLQLENELVRIEARQLCQGKRYIFQRLLAGRFADFWKMNADIAIRGTQRSLDSPNEFFAIEPIESEKLIQFTPGEMTN